MTILNWKLVILLFAVKFATPQTIPQSGLVDMKLLAGVLKAANTQVNALLHSSEQQTPKQAQPAAAIGALPIQAVAASDDFDEKNFKTDAIDEADLVFVKVYTTLKKEEVHQKLYDGFKEELTKQCEADKCHLKVSFISDVPEKREPVKDAEYFYATAQLNDNTLFPGHFVDHADEIKKACGRLGLDVLAIKSYSKDNGKDDNDDNDKGDGGDDKGDDDDKGDKGNPKKKNVGLIVGLVALGLVMASVIIGLVIMNRRKRQQQQSTVNAGY